MGIPPGYFFAPMNNICVRHRFFVEAFDLQIFKSLYNFLHNRVNGFQARGRETVTLLPDHLLKELVYYFNGFF
jgi:hypothetical protein